MLGITRQHLGLIIVILGTIALAFSVKTEEQHESDRKEAEKRNPHMEKLWSPVRVTVRRYLFYGGLLAIAIGTLMQW